MQNQQVLSIWEKSGRMCVPERYLETIIINESNILRWHNIDFCCTAINLQFISIDKNELRGQEFDSGSSMFSSPVARPSSQEYHISKQSPLISECVKISVVRGCRVPDLDTWYTCGACLCDSWPVLQPLYCHPTRPITPTPSARHRRVSSSVEDRAVND